MWYNLIIITKAHTIYKNKEQNHEMIRPRQDLDCKTQTRLHFTHPIYENEQPINELMKQ